MASLTPSPIISEPPIQRPKPKLALLARIIFITIEAPKTVTRSAEEKAKLTIVRQERNEEQRDLGVQDLDDEAVEQRPLHRLGLADHRLRVLQPGADHADAEPDEIGRAGKLHRHEQLRHMLEHRRQAESGGENMDIAAEMNAQHRHQPGLAAMRDGLGSGVEQGRPGKIGDEQRQRGEGQQGLPGCHQTAALVPTGST